ncbi:MAG: hypothetical protein ABS76_26485 [Pelagibacterium sp. SCN 64-44]|nr:MAG: hypothetical protein ABS76_26485 [Pelagibacterium sp. SCN 64-44]
MTQRILFLDIDGVLCTTRASLAHGEYGLSRYMDTVAIEFLNRLHEAAPYSIVVTSTWRNEVDCTILLPAVGILAPLAHPEWRTGIHHSGPSSFHDRPREIDGWLSKHGSGVDYLILDDSMFSWTDDQHARWVKCDSQDGISFQAMNEAFALFGADWPQVKRA